MLSSTDSLVPEGNRALTVGFAASRGWVWMLSVLYAAIALFSAWQVADHARARTRYLQEACAKLSLQNEENVFLSQLLRNLNASQTQQHPFLYPLFIKDRVQSMETEIRNYLKMLTEQNSSQQLAMVPKLLQLSRQESALTVAWACLLVGASALYIAAMIAVHNGFRARNVFLSLACVSTVFLIVGIMAPTLALFTAIQPTAMMSSPFVLQCQIRSIASAIRELFESGNWIIGALIMLLSVVTPLVKIALSAIAAASDSQALRAPLAKFLHAIGKWSMVDVFIAAVLLACFALRSQQGAQAEVCVGFYFFLGYCLLSMMTSSLLVSAEQDIAVTAGVDQPRVGRRIWTATIWGAVGAIVTMFVMIGILGYGARKADLNEAGSEQVNAPVEVPMRLFAGSVDLPAHHWRSLPFNLPYIGCLRVDIHVVHGNPLNIALIDANQLAAIEGPNHVIPPASLLRASVAPFRAVQIRNYHRFTDMEAGNFILVIQDPSLGLLSHLNGQVSVHVKLRPIP